METEYKVTTFVSHSANVTVPYAEFERLESLLPEVAALGDRQHRREEGRHLPEGRGPQLGGGPRDVPPGDDLVEALDYADLMG